MPWPMGSLQPYLEGDYAAGHRRPPHAFVFRFPRSRDTLLYGKTGVKAWRSGPGQRVFTLVGEQG
jgi:hypothetical protein